VARRACQAPAVISGPMPEGSPMVSAIVMLAVPGLGVSYQAPLVSWC
jgi:hypothetical protein